jgi:two-component system, chemotaxis family, CheB/CheR fusion protein
LKKKQSNPANLWTRVAHDMRQPIQSLLLLSHLMAMTDDRAQRQTTARSMEDSLLALQSMIENLTAVSKLEAGTTRPAPTPLAFGPLLQVMTTTLTGIVHDPHRKIASHVEPLTVTTDRLMLATLMNWLAHNLAHMARTGDIALHCRRVGDTAYLNCQYSGKAPTPTQLNAIFIEVKPSSSATPSASVVPGLGFIATFATHIAAELEYTSQALDRQTISLKIHDLEQGPAVQADARNTGVGKKTS